MIAPLLPLKIEEESYTLRLCYWAASTSPATLYRGFSNPAAGLLYPSNPMGMPQRHSLSRNCGQVVKSYGLPLPGRHPRPLPATQNPRHERESRAKRACHKTLIFVMSQRQLDPRPQIKGTSPESTCPMRALVTWHRKKRRRKKIQSPLSGWIF